MKAKLLNAATTLSKEIEYCLTDFDDSKEKLDEGFALVRAPRPLFLKICEENDLPPEATELLLMCLKPEFADGRTHSLPHKHYHSSLTAVVPLSKGGTFLPDDYHKRLLHLYEGQCFIDGCQPHAFGTIGKEPFIAAIAVINLEEQTEPVRIKDGEYRTSILNVAAASESQLELER